MSSGSGDCDFTFPDLSPDTGSGSGSGCHPRIPDCPSTVDGKMYVLVCNGGGCPEWVEVQQGCGGSGSGS